MHRTPTHLAALAPPGAVRQVLTFNPAVSGWLLVPAMVVCLWLVWLLYRAQRQLASQRLVNALMVIRGLLVLLVFGLLLRPTRIWSQTATTPPTLWLLIDQSLSMAQIDEQSSDIEKLRWADALGYVAADLRPSKLDRIVARVSALREELGHLQRQTATDSERGNEAKELAALAAAMKSWNSRLTTLTDTLWADARMRSSESATVVSHLKLALTLMRDGMRAAGARTRPQEAAGDVPWSRVAAALDAGIVQLRPMADSSDEQFLSQHGRESAVVEALLKVSKLRRADLAYTALTSPVHGSEESMPGLLEHQRTRVLAFGLDQRMVGSDDNPNLFSQLKTAGEPVGSATDLAGALRFVSEQIVEGESASVLVIGDGRATTGGDGADAARRLADRGTRVFSLAVGSRRLVPDAAVESLDAPDWIYADDTVQILASMRLDDLSGKPVTVELRRGGTLVDTQTIKSKSNQSTQILTFKDKPPGAGVYAYEVSIVPVAGETIVDNNRQSVRVAVKKDKLQALVIEDQPRWEYRYLANYLKRDNRVHLQTVLLEPAQVKNITPPTSVKASPLNAMDEAQVLPQTVEEWSAFDMIVLGDVPTEFLSPAAQQNIAKAVSDRGATLIVIAGPLNMPARYSGTPLAEILPVEVSGSWPAAELAEQLKNGFRLSIAPEGQASILSQFSPDASANTRLWAAAPAWYWHADQTQVKASASVLWQVGQSRPGTESAPALDDTLAAARGRAVLSTMPLGLGRVMFLASDSTWRVRQVDGENLHERFWGQVVRWVAGTDMPAGGRFVRFGADKSHYVAGDTVHITARILKEDFTPLAGEKFKVIARSADADKAGSGLAAEAEMEDSPQAPGLYHAQIRNVPAGTIELALQGARVEKLLADDPAASEKTLQLDVLAGAVVEHQNINPDRATLTRIATEGDGIALDAEYAGVLAAHVPEYERELTSTREFGLFGDAHASSTRAAHWGFLVLFVVLISAEWMLRKAGGLV